MAIPACYMAKNEGRNRIHEYKPETRQLETHEGQANWTSKLSVALQENRFVLYEQEKINLKNLELPASKSEILLRMLGEDGENILPIGVPSRGGALWAHSTHRPLGNQELPLLVQRTATTNR